MKHLAIILLLSLFVFACQPADETAREEPGQRNDTGQQQQLPDRPATTTTYGMNLNEKVRDLDPKIAQLKQDAEQSSDLQADVRQQITELDQRFQDVKSRVEELDSGDMRTQATNGKAELQQALQEIEQTYTELRAQIPKLTDKY